MLIGQYHTVFKYSKDTVNSRNINKNTRRRKLALASFIDRPRLVKKSK